MEAIIEAIDEEVADLLESVVERSKTPWKGFVDENVTWVELALEPEIRRIVLLDDPAVLGDRARWAAVARALPA